jgi:hypothetical protein
MSEVKMNVAPIPEYNERDFWSQSEIDEMNDILQDLGLDEMDESDF